MNIGSDYSFLFSNTSSQDSSSLFGSGSMLSEYSNIKSGTYLKVLKAYYAKKSAEKSDSTDSSSGSKTAASTKVTDQIQTDADALKSSAAALTAKGSKSLFVEKELTVTNQDGTKTTKNGYDMDAIYNAVKKFTDNYNRLIDSGSDASSTSVLNQTLHMTSMTKNYAKLLGEVGITIGTDNKLTVDEKTMKAADMSTMKTLFNGNASYAYNVSTKASMLQITAKSEAGKNNIYNKNGAYDQNYTTGNLINSIF